MVDLEMELQDEGNSTLHPCHLPRKIEGNGNTPRVYTRKLSTLVKQKNNCNFFSKVNYFSIFLKIYLKKGIWGNYSCYYSPFHSTIFRAIDHSFLSGKCHTCNIFGKMPAYSFRPNDLLRKKIFFRESAIAPWGKGRGCVNFFCKDQSQKPRKSVVSRLDYIEKQKIRFRAQLKKYLFL